MKTTLLILASTTLVSQLASAIPPLPPEGKRWVRNEKFSDEFNGTELDSSKWFDHHPNWTGRPPGIFLASQVSLGDGFMKIQSKKLEEKMTVRGVDYDIAGGAVVSKTTDAHFGYYECRFKAAATTMSTTFWLSTRKQYPVPGSEGDKFGQELDIQECIGREGDFKGKYFASGMNSNGHFWYNPKGGETQDLRATEAKVKTEKLASEAFNTYGGWWKDARTASFYLNDGEPKDMVFYDKILDEPFPHPMGLNMVSETYPFPWIELPGKEELNDPERNTCYYDWVRSYILVDADAPTPEGVELVPLYEEEIDLSDAFDSHEPVKNIIIPFSYKANQDRNIELQIRDSEGKVIGESNFKALTGYANTSKTIELKDAPKSGSYTVTATLSALDSDDAKPLASDEIKTLKLGK
ncbi:beta-porphyranase D [Luteolibacter algae]|uniref:Beta-porphyranase D n=1 Tax=Luteolibacter algae TaxID=454151 RepID=A0ABW5DDY4_9BACT